EEPAAVRRKGDGDGVTGVAAELPQLLAAAHVPEPHDRLVTARSGPLAVGGEGHGPDPAGVALEPLQLLLRRPSRNWAAFVSRCMMRSPAGVVSTAVRWLM